MEVALLRRENAALKQVTHKDSCTHARTRARAHKHTHSFLLKLLPLTFLHARTNSNMLNLMLLTTGTAHGDDAPLSPLADPMT